MAVDFRRIGQGFCATVWADATRAMKREDGGPGRSLHNDYVMHQEILKSLCDRSSTAYVPGCYQYIPGDHQAWWDEHLSRFPKDFQIPCNILLVDRIPPFPDSVRNTIIDKYCPESLNSAIKLSEPDRDCIIRLYLGRRRRSVRSRFKAFSLRNYPLHADQVEDLALDGSLYARIMAETLAVLYWKAHIDANDVEFVLAPPPSPDHSVSSNEALAPQSITNSHALGEHVLWLLDFDCCRHMPLDEKGVEQAVSAFCRNDPYYPRPRRGNSKDQALWVFFKDRFLEASEGILEDGSPEARLPALWVELVEQREKL